MKRILSLLLALVLVFGLVPATTFAAAEPIRLTVWAGFDEMDWLNRQLKAFEAANPQWDITWNIGEYETYDSFSIRSASYCSIPANLTPS